VIKASWEKDIARGQIEQGKEGDIALARYRFPLSESKGNQR
jgi:hypothetical protein